MSRIAIATCLNLPEPDNDQEIILSKFTTASLEPCLAAWDDPSVDWSSFDAVVIRSTWDYPERPVEFQRWVESVDELTLLLNPASIVVPNLDKRYLLRLSETGIPIIPTGVVKQDLQELAQIDSDRIVIKPAIGAGSYLTAFFERSDRSAMTAHVASIENFGTVALAQPFMESVPNGGERSLIWIDGEFTHKIVKQPRFTGDDESVSESSVPFEPDELKMANHVMDTVQGYPLYARVDIIEDKGRYVLNELELVEPSLFFMQNPDALDRLVAGVRNRI